jgi:hypothetical protein
LLSVPGLVLMPAGTALGMVGIDVVAYTITTDIALRAVGGALLVALVVANRRRADAEGEGDPESTETTPTAA